MLDAVSATDCLIQIVKERRSFGCCGVAFYSTAFSSQALFSKAFRGITDRLFALPLALSMEAHYRDIIIGKALIAIKLRKNANS